jgi:hypothetical protein
MKQRSRTRACLLVSWCVFIIAGGAAHGDTITLVSENFDALTNTSTETLPSDWRADVRGTVRTLGNYGLAGDTTTRAGGNSLSSTAANGIYNYFAGSASTATDNAIGFLSTGTGTQSGNLYVELTNSSVNDVTSLNIAYDIEKYRNGTNSSGFSVQLYYSTDGVAWTNAGSSFLSSFGNDTNNNGFAAAPGVTEPVSGALNIPILAGSSLFLAWNYSVTSGGVTSNAQALGMDNVIITGETPADVAAVPLPLAALGGLALLPVALVSGLRRQRRAIG